MTTKTVSIRADADLLARIDEIAASQDRSRNWWINRQLEEAIAYDIRFRAKVQEALGQVERGEFASEDEIETIMTRMRASAE